MGFWQRLFHRLRKTFTGTDSNADWTERIEEWLISTDVPLDLVEALVQQAEKHCRRSSPDEYIACWRTQLLAIFQNARPADDPTTLIERYKPAVYLFVGVNGTGKTTSVARFARLLQTQHPGIHPLLVAADTFRAGAQEQLAIWAHRLNLPIIQGQYGQDPAAIAYQGLHKALSQKLDAVLIDTAGRLHTRQPLMDQLAKIVRVLKKLDETAPHTTFLVIDATTGQNGIRQAEVFSQYLPISGIIATKMDGTTRGGILLGIVHQFRLPIFYVGTGEGADDLLPFSPEEYIQALLPSPHEWTSQSTALP